MIAAAEAIRRAAAAAAAAHVDQQQQQQHNATTRQGPDCETSLVIHVLLFVASADAREAADNPPDPHNLNRRGFLFFG